MNFALLGMVRHIIERATNVGAIEINRGRSDLIAKRQHREDRLYRAGGTQQMPRHGFGRTHRKRGSVSTKHSFNGSSLRQVARRG